MSNKQNHLPPAQNERAMVGGLAWGVRSLGRVFAFFGIGFFEKKKPAPGYLIARRNEAPFAVGYAEHF